MTKVSDGPLLFIISNATDELPTNCWHTAGKLLFFKAHTVSLLSSNLYHSLVKNFRRYPFFKGVNTANRPHILLPAAQWNNGQQFFLSSLFWSHAFIYFFNKPTLSSSGDTSSSKIRFQNLNVIFQDTNRSQGCISAPNRLFFSFHVSKKAHQPLNCFSLTG